jgi:hypothetical protein
MWKLVLVYFGVSLALFCSPIKGKEVLEKVITEREKVKGNELISYKIDSIDKTDSTQSVFFITARVKNNSKTIEVKDTISIFTTMDGILIDQGK